MNYKKVLLLSLILVVSLNYGCGKVTSETSSKQGKTATPVATITGTIEVLADSDSKDNNGFTVNDNEIYLVFTKVKPDGAEEDIAWGKSQKELQKIEAKTIEPIAKKSWQKNKSIIDKAINNVITPNSIETTMNIPPTKDEENDKKEKDKKNKENIISTPNIIPTHNEIVSFSYDKRDKEIKAAQGDLIYINWVSSPNQHWEYTIKDVKKGPAYFIIRAYNKNADKLFATYVEGSSISTSNTTITIQPMDVLSTLRAYVLICGERNDGRIDYGKVSIKNLKKRVTRTLIKKMNYALPDLRQDNFKSKDPRFKTIPKEGVESEIASAISKEDASFDQYKVFVQSLTSGIINDEARKYLLMENPPQDEPIVVPKNIEKNKKKIKIEEESSTDETTPENKSEPVTSNKEI